MQQIKSQNSMAMYSSFIQSYHHLECSPPLSPSSVQVQPIPNFGCGHLSAVLWHVASHQTLLDTLCDGRRDGAPELLDVCAGDRLAERGGHNVGVEGHELLGNSAGTEVLVVESRDEGCLSKSVAALLI